jgi:hypothetical protein
VEDYYPLVKGRVLEYKLVDARGEAVVRTEFLAVERKPSVVKGKARRSTVRPGAPDESFAFTVTKDASGVFTTAWGREFPLPLVEGRKWRRYPNQYKIDTTHARQAVPAGDFTGCLQVSFLAAGGDVGGGRRLYAPGVGLIYSFSSDESDAFELALTKIY